MIKTRLHKQRGLSLVELMVGMVAGLIVVGGVTSVYLTTIVTSANTLKQSKLNQEVTTLVSVMASDIRRAGIWGSTQIDYQSPQNNPFAQVNDTALEVFAAITDTDDAGVTGSGVCIVYTYDVDTTDGTDVTATDLRGFRLNNGAVEMRQQGDITDTGNLCNDADDTWLPVTDSDVINVSALTFSLASSSCLNTREPDETNNDSGIDGTTDEADEYDCYRTDYVSTDAGDITVETRFVDINLTANLTSDSTVSLSMTQSVRVRNDLIRIR